MSAISQEFERNCIARSDFKTPLLSQTIRPNLVACLAMGQDYSEVPIIDRYSDFEKLSDRELGDRLVEKCLKNGHWGVIEHINLVFNIVNYPHSVIVQARTHRAGVSFDCQSQRYTSKRIVALWKKIQGKTDFEFIFKAIEEVFYFRPIGKYWDRDGHKYLYSKEERSADILMTSAAIEQYVCKMDKGYAPEHARDILTQNIRQHFVVSINARSLLHFCDLRLPKDAQLEIRCMAIQMFDIFAEVMPEVAEYYIKTRYGKSKLAP